MAIDWDSVVLSPVMGTFEESVLYMPAAGAPFAANGVFTEGYESVDLGPDTPPATSELPRLGVRLSQLAATPGQGDQVIVRSFTYVVQEVRLDSHGRADLILNFVSA